MLDIIIPTYKNKKGLVKTLQSINWNNPNLEVTIVDDYSLLDYRDIQEMFPKVKSWIYLNKNSGPGVARQHGIEATMQPFITFIDTGDYFISTEVQDEIIETIQQDSRTKLFMWHFNEGNIPSKSTNNHLHGKVYRREFLAYYNITFSEEGSYANEDIGFNRTCRTILRNLEETYPYTCLRDIDKVVLTWVRDDKNSLTLKNNGSFAYEKQNIGLALNMRHAYDILTHASINKIILFEEISEIMGYLYSGFICTLIERPQFIEESWAGAKIFYDKVFSQEKIDEDIIQTGCSRAITHLRKHFNNKLPLPVNMQRFLVELKTNSMVSNYYLTFLQN